MSYDEKFIHALVFSLIIEIAVVLILSFLLDIKKKPADIIFAGFITTFSSIIYLWYLLPICLSGIEYLIVGEVLVFLYEMLLYKKILGIKWWQALVFSLIANIASFTLGMMIF